MKRFQATYKGRSIWDMRTPRSGIRYSAVFEWLEAAHWDGYTKEAFEDLNGERQSLIVAHYRTHMQIEAVLAQEQARKARPKRSPKGPHTHGA